MGGVNIPQEVKRASWVLDPNLTSGSIWKVLFA